MLQDEVRALHTQLDAQAQMISGLVKEVDETKHTVSLLESRLTQTNADLNNKLEDKEDNSISSSSRPTIEARRRALNRLYQLNGKQDTDTNTTDTPHKGDK